MNNEQQIKERAEKLIKKIKGATFTRGRRDVLILYDEISSEVSDLEYALDDFPTPPVSNYKKGKAQPEVVHSSGIMGQLEYWQKRAKELESRIASLESTPKEEGHQWVSVEERLPPHGEWVLLMVQNQIEMGMYSKGEYQIPYVASKFWRTNVTHWMPLPSPPTDKPENE